MKKPKLSKLLALCLCASLLLMTACQGGVPASPAPEEPSSGSVAPSSQPQEEPTMALPEDTTELTVPLQVVAPGTDGIFSPGEWSYSTQADVDVCRQWLYDLRAEDITALYGLTQPMDRYWTGEMSMEDSRRVINLLRSMASGIAPLEGGNPATGGGWDIALYTGDKAVDFGFDGFWFTFTHQGTIWIFDATDPAVVESGYEIETLLWEYGYNGRSPSDATPENPVTEDVPTETYFSDDIQAIYAVDRDNYVMAQVKDGYASSKAIWDELQNRVPSNGEPSGYGFLIITDEGKEYVYMDTEEPALNKYCQAALNAGPLHPSWLIHMTPERIEKVSMMGTSTTTDRDELLAVAKFLREEVTVRPMATIYDGVNNPDTVGGLYDWRITFDSGVEYTIIGYAGEDDLYLYTSDLDKHVHYQLDEGVDWKFIEFEGRDWP